MNSELCITILHDTAAPALIVKNMAMIRGRLRDGTFYSAHTLKSPAAVRPHFPVPAFAGVRLTLADASALLGNGGVCFICVCAPRTFFGRDA